MHAYVHFVVDFLLASGVVIVGVMEVMSGAGIVIPVALGVFLIFVGMCHGGCCGLETIEE